MIKELAEQLSHGNNLTIDQMTSVMDELLTGTHTDEDVAEHLQDMVNIPQVDGALYGIYYGNLAEGFLRLDPYGHSIMMHPKTLKSIMRACCAIGFYTQESIAKADEIWNAPEKPKKIKYHYCFSCKANTVVDINERVCDSCKSISSGDSDQITYY